MNKLSIIVFALFGATCVMADEVITIEWNVIGIQDAQFNIEGGGGIEKLTLDTRWSTYGAANGVLLLDTGLSITATGTCFFATNGIFCDLNVRGSTVILVLDSDTGSGEISVISEAGFLIQDGAAVLKSIN